MAVRRLFGLKADAGGAGAGSSYDDLVSGAIPDADEFWPITGGNLDENIGRLDREDEARGRRAAVPSSAFQAAPVITVPIYCYRSLAEKILKRCLGGADTMTGTAPASITHSIAALEQGGSVYLPPSYAQLVRDDLNQKMSGGAINRAAFAFPMDGYGTIEAEIWGLYAAHFAAATPSAVFTGLSEEPMMLRDAQVFIDGSGTSIPDLQGFEFTWVNNLTRKHYAKRNIVTQLIGTPVRTRKVWWPEENKIGAAQEVTYAINFGNVSTAQELALVYGQIQKFVFEVTGAPLATTPPSTELLRITIFAGEHTGGGPEALSARDDLTARYEGRAFYSESDSKDVLVEVVNNIATAIT